MHDDEDEWGEHVPHRHFFAAVAVFLVADVMSTAEYYRDVFGFEIDLTYGDPVSFASVFRDAAVINLRLAEGAAANRNHTATDGVDAMLIVSDVDEVFEEMEERGAKIVSPPVSFEYGLREFRVEDCNHYRLAVAEELGA